MISIVIPCFNEQLVLPEMFRRMTAAADLLSEDWEVICIDDGSQDETWALLEKQARLDSRWKALSFSRNFGHQTAVSAGLNYANGDAVVIMDADLQDPPEELPRFIEKWREGFQVVHAIRRQRKEWFLKRFAYWLFYRLMSRLVAFPIALDSGDFCLLDRMVVDLLNQMEERNRFVRGLRAWAGFKQVGIEYERDARWAGKPKYTFRGLLKLAFDGIFSFSTIPLRLASYVGLLISALAVGGAIFTFFQRTFSEYFSSIGLEPVPGFATTVISVLFLGGVQLLCLGILGEYLGRIYEEVKRRPLWVVRDCIGLEDRKAPKADRTPVEPHSR